MNIPYIATNLEELMDKASPEIQELVGGKEIDDATALLGKIYKIPISSYVALSNIILFILLGALKPEDTVRAIVDILHLTEEEAYRLAQDMEKTILEKARIQILGKSPKDMVTLTFPEGRSQDELRKELLDTTKRESLFQNQESAPTTQTTTPPQKKLFAAAGSRSQLLEQLQVLDDIPTDEEISERLQKIQQQIAGMKQPVPSNPQIEANLSELVAKEGEATVAEPEAKPASYSKAPTKYNVDPYREVAQ